MTGQKKFSLLSYRSRSSPLQHFDITSGGRTRLQTDYIENKYLEWCYQIPISLRVSNIIIMSHVRKESDPGAHVRIFWAAQKVVNCDCGLLLVWRLWRVDPTITMALSPGWCPKYNKAFCQSNKKAKLFLNLNMLNVVYLLQKKNIIFSGNVSREA